MIGLAGHIKNNKDYTKDMLKEIEYRGQNKTFYDDDFLYLGKISNGEEIFNKMNIYIILDGNIENNTNKNDNDYIFDLYIKNKENIFSILNGNFSLFIYDKKQHKIVIGRDKFGSKPLYYTKNPFIFATEAKAILKNQDYKKKFNSDGLKDFLLYLNNPNDETLFKGIYKVPIGSYIVYENNKITSKKYYEFEFKNYETNEDKLINELKTAIEKNIKLPDKCASFLSSGIDSSLITSINKPADTYTIGYEENKYDETSSTKVLCKILKINNNIKIVNREEYINALKEVEFAMDEPCCDPAVISLFIGAREASKKYRMIASGESIDELFAGYYPYLDPIIYQKYEKLPKRINKIISKIAIKTPEFKGINFIIRRTTPYEDFYSGVSRVFNNYTLDKLLLNKKKSNLKKINKQFIKSHYNNIEKMQAIDINTWMIEELHATERMCAYNKIEAITPFLNNDFINIASKTMIDNKLLGNQTKLILRKVVQDYIPHEAYNSKKIGFPVPIKMWIKEDDYHQKILEAFNNDTANKFFNTKMLNKWLKQNQKNKKDYQKQIWAIYSFIIWYDIYFKD